MTSNIGSHILLEEKDRSEGEKAVLQLLRQTLRPEFLNRIDEVVMFQWLEREQLKKIVAVHAGKLNQLLRSRSLQIEFTDEAEDLLCVRGYDRDYGARPLKRVFQQDVQNPLSVEILAGRFAPGAQICVGVRAGALVFTTR